MRTSAKKDVAVQSAGILLFRRKPELELLLLHPGGPYWRAKDKSAWTIPKGLVDPEEDQLAAAKREFREETGWELLGIPRPLGTFKLSSAKRLAAWAVEGDADPPKLKSNNFTMVWPPKSGTLQSFPEIDRAAWFTPEEARVRITKGQLPLIDALLRLLSEGRAI